MEPLVDYQLLRSKEGSNDYSTILLSPLDTSPRFIDQTQLTSEVSNMILYSHNLQLINKFSDRMVPCISS